MGKITGLKFGINLEKLIGDLEIDEEGWADSNSIKIDYSGKVFLYLENHLFHKMDEKEGIILYVKRIGPAEGDYFIDASKIMGILHRVSSEDIENNREEGSIIVKLAHISSIAKQIREAEKSENYELAAKLRDQQKRKKF